MFDRFFTKSIFISLVIHAVIIGGSNFTNFGKFPKSAALKELEITYCKAKERPNPPAKKQAVAKVSLPPNTEDKAPATETNKAPRDKRRESSDVGPGAKRIPKSAEELPTTPAEPAEKKIVPKNQFVELKKGGPLNTDPAYISYYEAIREKIRAYALYNYKRRSEEGRIYVNFSLSRDGSLTSLKIQDERSDKNGYLKDVVKHSIAQAAPFSQFPNELAQAEIAFSVLISFSGGNLGFSRQ